ncbi:protein-tyrosine phosphatase-like protein [Spinellus fusiger]|nr:protein-tyrosine phosphatase-like protein [Spinellus fusiger]
MACMAKNSCIQEIVPGVFVGDFSAAQSRTVIDEHNITHVLSLGSFTDLYSDLTYKNIDILDVPETNIIQHFEETFDFIDKVQKQNKCILVHCEAGVSRSPTVVAAYLVKSKGIKPSEALEIIKGKREVISPNHGFLAQLVLYDRLGYDVDSRHTEYRRFLMAIMAEEQKVHGYIQNFTLAPDPEYAPGNNSSETNTKSYTALRCRKCRRVLVEADNVIDHERGQGQGAFAYLKRDSTINATENVSSLSEAGPSRNTVNQTINPLLASLASSNSNCSSYFIEPMEWIQGLQDGSFHGRIDCPKCYSKLGSYNWSGEQCSCGQWVTPAFMLHSKQVDQVRNIKRK